MRLLPGLRNTSPLRVTATRIASSLSASFMAIGFLAFTMTTAAPLVNIGVITMKMISRTSMTSTIGVTLMSDVTSGAFFNCIKVLLARYPDWLLAQRDHSQRAPPAPLSPAAPAEFQLAKTTTDLLPGAGFLGALEEVVHQLGAGVPHLDVERLDATREVVVHPDCGDSDEQTHGGGDQGFRNTARHCAQTGRLLRRNTLERVDDADHRSEQSHEGAGRTDGCQAGDASLQLGMHDSFGAFQSALGRLNLFT